MWRVIIALIPALAWALYYFGLSALLVVLVAILGCVATEYCINRWMFRADATIANGSAILTGLLLGLNLPSNLDWWIVLIGAVVAIGIGKMAFGGLGCNIFNPALVGRVFLLLSFPAQMTTWPYPNAVDAATGATATMGADGLTGATVLGQLKQALIEPEKIDMLQTALGSMGGSLGEVSAIALLIGFVYLLWRKVISWHIPVSIIVTAFVFAFLLGGCNLTLACVEILSGGLLLGAIFMATDYVSSPMSHRGMLLYGFCIGLITILIRFYGAYPEGMSFAILLMNGFTPLINRYIKPVKFGEKGVKK